METNKIIYSKEELEDFACNINKTYFPERLLSPIALDPYDLVDKLNCNVTWKYISPCTDILGMTFFDNGYWYIWDSGSYTDGDRPHEENFSKGTIIINQIVLDNSKREEENFIVTHEVSHWLKDQNYFQNQKNENMLHVCKKNDFGKTYWHSRMSTLEIIEKQTNYLAAAILMPREIIRNTFFKLCRYKNIPDHPIEYKVFMKKHISTLAKMFNVNYNPMLYRLKDIGVFEKI